MSLDFVQSEQFRGAKKREARPSKLSFLDVRSQGVSWTQCRWVDFFGIWEPSVSRELSAPGLLP